MSSDLPSFPHRIVRIEEIFFTHLFVFVETGLPYSADFGFGYSGKDLFAQRIRSGQQIEPARAVEKQLFVSAGASKEVDDERERKASCEGVITQVVTVAGFVFIKRSGIHAGNSRGDECERSSLRQGISDDLKREMRSPPDAHARPFEETERRIETNGLVVRQIRGRSDSRLISVAMLPVQYLDNSQFATYLIII